MRRHEGHPGVDLDLAEVVAATGECRDRHRARASWLGPLAGAVVLVLAAAALITPGGQSRGEVTTYGAPPAVPVSSMAGESTTAPSPTTTSPTTVTVEKSGLGVSRPLGESPSSASVVSTLRPFTPAPPTTTMPPDPTVTLFPLPRPESHPSGITRGPDGNLWVTENGAGARNVVARITPQGAITELRTSDAGSAPESIVAGPDGNLWFTEPGRNSIGRITPAGFLTDFPIPTPNSQPTRGMTVGPDGAIWFTERNASQVGRITGDGHIDEFALAPGSLPGDIVTGPDGNLWFLGQWDLLGRMTPSGAVTEFHVHSGHYLVALGGDGRGNLWYQELNPTNGEASLVRRSPAGDVRTFALEKYVNIMSIVEGPGGIWFSEWNRDLIGRLAPDGSITEFAAPTPEGLTVGADGNIWFTTGRSNKVGRLRLR